MSKFSGKCDFYDDICIFGDSKDFFNNLSLNMWSESGDIQPVDLKSEKDLVLYYPFVPGFMFGSDGKHVFGIGRKSFITTENEEMLEIYKKHLLRVYNRCKRKKIEYDPAEAFKEACGNWTDRREDIMELARRVGEKGKRASIDGLIWSPIVDYYRKDWKDAIVAAGFDEDFAEKWVMEH